MDNNIRKKRGMIIRKMTVGEKSINKATLLFINETLYSRGKITQKERDNIQAQICAKYPV